MDRNYFDMTRKIHIPEYNLDLINGFSTAIASYDNKLLLNAELMHKLLHKRTVYDLMGELYSSSRDDGEFRDKCHRELIGRTIMTK